MFFKSQPLAAVALFALAAQTQDTCILDITQASATALPDDSWNIWDRVCITNKQVKNIEVKTKACQRAINRLLDDDSFILPAVTGCVQLVNAGGCSIGICGNEPIRASVVGAAAQELHAGCKPEGEKSKHIVAGTIMTHNFERVDGAISGPAKIIMGSVEGLQADHFEVASTSPTRAHARDLHTPKRTLDGRADNENNHPVPGPDGFRLVFQGEEDRPASLAPSAAQALEINVVRNWGDARTHFSETFGAIAVQGEAGVRIDYAAHVGHNLLEVPLATRQALVNAIVDFRRRRGNPWWFSTRVFRGTAELGLMVIQVILPDAQGNCYAGPAPGQKI
jgi:hypothetical protein